MIPTEKLYDIKGHPIIYGCSLDNHKNPVWVSGVFVRIEEDESTSPTDYCLVSQTDKRAKKDLPFNMISLFHSYMVPKEALTGKMTPNRLREYLQNTPDFTPVAGAPKGYQTKAEHIDGIVANLTHIVKNYEPISQ